MHHLDAVVVVYRSLLSECLRTAEEFEDRGRGGAGDTGKRGRKVRKQPDKPGVVLVDRLS